jgi:predicted rRNA methylase YqxC with S4 and FtsJ domains
MVKPQFEIGERAKNAGVVKNDTERRRVLKDFETWAKKLFIIEQKSDSTVAGARGNQERFYKLKLSA